MHKNLIILLLTVSTLALLVIGIHQNQQLRNLDRKIDQAKGMKGLEETAVRTSAGEATRNVGNVVRNSAAPRESKADKERLQHEKTVQQPKPQLETNSTPPQTSGGEPPTKSADEPPLAGLAEMLKSPGMKDMLRAQQKAILEVSYGSLLKYLQLPPEELEGFKELLVEKQMALMDIGLDAMDTSIPADKRKEKAQRAGDLTKEFDEKIRTLLGEDNYEVYKQYEDYQPDMMQVNLFKPSLGSGDQLNEEQEHKLIIAMHEERKKNPFSTELNQQETFDPSMFTEETIAKHMDMLARLQESYIARARDILSESQLNQFISSLKQQRAMQEMSMKMARQMFLKPSEKAKPAK